MLRSTVGNNIVRLFSLVKSVQIACSVSLAASDRGLSAFPRTTPFKQNFLIFEFSNAATFLTIHDALVLTGAFIIGALRIS